MHFFQKLSNKMQYSKIRQPQQMPKFNFPTRIKREPRCSKMMDRICISGSSYYSISKRFRTKKMLQGKLLFSWKASSNLHRIFKRSKQKSSHNHYLINVFSTCKGNGCSISKLPSGRNKWTFIINCPNKVLPTKNAVQHQTLQLQPFLTILPPHHRLK